MRKIKYLLKLLSPEIVICIALFISAFSLLLTGIHFFCSNPTPESNIHRMKENPEQIQKNVAKNIIRLHVIANSDTEADQQLKLKIRDEIINSLQDALQNVESITDAKEIILACQTQIEETAYRTLMQQGSSYSVKVSLGSRYFPVKQYGDLFFPAGKYQALCVEIGEAEGRNWWCVLFPSLCFVDETTATVPDTSKDKLKECLTEEEYQYLSENEIDDSSSKTEIPNTASSASPIPSKVNSKPELHLGIVEWIKNLKK